MPSFILKRVNGVVNSLECHFFLANSAHAVGTVVRPGWLECERVFSKRVLFSLMIN